MSEKLLHSRIEALKRQADNARKTVEYEKAKAAEHRLQTQAIIDAAEGKSVAIANAARSEADRLLSEARAVLQEAQAARAGVDETVAGLVAKAQAATDDRRMQLFTEMKDFVLGISFLRQETLRLAAERQTLEADIATLTERKRQLDLVMATLEQKYESVTKRLKV